MTKAGFKPNEVRNLMQTIRKRYRRSGLEAILAPQAFLQPRILVIIAARTIGSAVTRNQVRRRLKALFQALNFKTKQHDLIILVKDPAVAKLSYDDLKSFMSQVFREIAKQNPHDS